MGKNSKKNRIGVVFSTDPDYDYNYDEGSEESLEPREQNLRVMHDRKQRKGKTVTLVSGYVGSDEDLKNLAKILKSKCGVGGTAKDGEIIIQGAFKDKIKDILLAEGYSQTKTSGG